MQPQQRTSRRRQTFGVFRTNIIKTMGWQYASTDAGKLRLFVTYPDSQQVNATPQLVINGLLPFVTNPNLGPVVSNRLVETGPGSGVFVLEVEFTNPMTESNVVWLPANCPQVREAGGAYLTSHQEIIPFPVPPPPNIDWSGVHWMGAAFHFVHDQAAETTALINTANVLNITLNETPNSFVAGPGYLDVTFPSGGGPFQNLLIAGGAGQWLTTNGATVNSANLVAS